MPMAGEVTDEQSRPIFDVTHFDVIPLAPPQVDIDFQQKAYGLLFDYRDDSRSDPGLESFRIVNWIIASNHSQIIDVWDSLEAFNRTWLSHTASNSGSAFRAMPISAVSAARSTTANIVSCIHSIPLGPATACPRPLDHQAHYLS